MKPQVNEEYEYWFNAEEFAKFIAMKYRMGDFKDFDVCDSRAGFIMRVRFHEFTSFNYVLLVGGYGLQTYSFDLQGYWGEGDLELDLWGFLQQILNGLDSDGFIVARTEVDAQ